MTTVYEAVVVCRNDVHAAVVSAALFSDSNSVVVCTIGTQIGGHRWKRVVIVGPAPEGSEALYETRVRDVFAAQLMPGGVVYWI